jgi:hypothetical protein
LSKGKDKNGGGKAEEGRSLPMRPEVVAAWQMLTSARVLSDLLVVSSLTGALNADVSYLCYCPLNFSGSGREGFGSDRC